MGFLDALKKTISDAARGLGLGLGASPVARALRRQASPRAERLLADAVRLAEIPSPTEKEELRAAFVSERLSLLGLSPYVDDDGNVLVRVSCESSEDPRPLLLFADLGTPRFHAVGSLARVDPEVARGAGLGDSLGAAALLSLAESAMDGSMRCARDLLLLFAARSLDEPRVAIFERLAADPKDRPTAALGIKGFLLGSLSPRPMGTYRIEVRLRTGAADQGPAEGAAAPSAVDAAVKVAQRLAGVRWDAEGVTSCRVRRIEAGTGFGRAPTDGLVDVELESADAAVMDIAMKAAVATAETAGTESGARTEVTVVGHVPVGDHAAAQPVAAVLKDLMKELRIRAREENGADAASFFTIRGIPAASVGIALGREGLDVDEVDIASLESGRRLVAAAAERLGARSID